MTVLNNDEIAVLERKKQAINVIKDGAGKQFDPVIAELFIQIMNNGNTL